MFYYSARKSYLIVPIFCRNFTKIEWANFVGLEFQDFVIEIRLKELNFTKIVKTLIWVNKSLALELA